MRFAARAVLAGLAGVVFSMAAVGAPPVDNGAECSFPIPGGQPAFIPDHVFVRFQAKTSAPAINAANGKAGVVEVLFDYAPLVPDLYCVRVAPGTVAKAIAAFQADPSVLYA